jgi:recombination protein RecR
MRARSRTDPRGHVRGQTPDRSDAAVATCGLVAAATAAAGGEEERQQGERREHHCEPKAGHTGDTRTGHGRIGGHNAFAVFSPSVENLVAQLTRLPGVGQRTAQRLAFHILQRPTDEALALAAALTEVKERVRFCRECGNLTEDETCAICLDARRDHATICVVEQPVDVVSLERTHEYRGLYHVLGGALSPIDGVEPSDLRIDELVRRVDANGVREVVLATNPTMTGEATAAYLADRLRDRVRVTRLASGLPVGGDLEYADEVTLGRALAGRREM